MTTITSTTNSATLTIKNTIVNACVQVAPPVFLEPVDKVRLLVQVFNAATLTGPIINEDKVYNVSELDQATLWFFIPSPSSGTVYYARASWSEYIEYTDIAGTVVVESPINWSEIEIIEFNNGSGGSFTPPPTTPTTPPPGTPTTPEPTPGPTQPPSQVLSAAFTGPSEVLMGATNVVYVITNYRPDVTYTVTVTGTIGGVANRVNECIYYDAPLQLGTSGIRVEARLGNAIDLSGKVITIARDPN